MKITNVSMLLFAALLLTFSAISLDLSAEDCVYPVSNFCTHEHSVTLHFTCGEPVTVTLLPQHHREIHLPCDCEVVKAVIGDLVIYPNDCVQGPICAYSISQFGFMFISECD